MSWEIELLSFLLQMWSFWLLKTPVLASERSLGWSRWGRSSNSRGDPKRLPSFSVRGKRGEWWASLPIVVASVTLQTWGLTSRKLKVLCQRYFINSVPLSGKKWQVISSLFCRGQRLRWHSSSWPSRDDDCKWDEGSVPSEFTISGVLSPRGARGPASTPCTHREYCPLILAAARTLRPGGHQQGDKAGAAEAEPTPYQTDSSFSVVQPNLRPPCTRVRRRGQAQSATWEHKASRQVLSSRSVLDSRKLFCLVYC